MLGLDHDNAKDLIEEAYNDKAGISKNFIMNGLKAAGVVFGDENMFAEDKWEFVNVSLYIFILDLLHCLYTSYSSRDITRLSVGSWIYSADSVF